MKLRNKDKIQEVAPRDLTRFRIAVFGLLEDWLADRRLGQGGPQPTLRDREVLTIEVVGEVLGIDTDSNLFAHFGRYDADWFPGLRKNTRTTFTGPTANLGKGKQEMWQLLMQRIPHDPSLSLVERFPVPERWRSRGLWLGGSGSPNLVGLARPWASGLAGGWGDCVRAPANIQDTPGAEELLPGIYGLARADRHSWKPDLFERLKTTGWQFLTPYQSAKRQKQPSPRFLTHRCYRSETVFGARARWPLPARGMSKFLSPTFAVFFWTQLNLPSLSFAHLVHNQTGTCG